MNVPNGADQPMREAVERTYRRLTGEDPVFIFSGWGGSLDEVDRAVVEDRFPDWDTHVAEAADELLMSGPAFATAVAERVFVAVNAPEATA